MASHVCVCVGLYMICVCAFARYNILYAHVKNCWLTPDVSCGESLALEWHSVVFFFFLLYV